MNQKTITIHTDEERKLFALTNRLLSEHKPTEKTPRPPVDNRIEGTLKDPDFEERLAAWHAQHNPPAKK